MKPDRPLSRPVTRCRICGSSDLIEVLSLGSTPLANAFVDPSDPQADALRFPLAVLHCSVCALAQLSVVVSPEVLFRNYLYASSASRPLVEHFRSQARTLIDRFGKNVRYIEVGSNDGVLLRPLRGLGANALGVEPASNLAAAANEEGLRTVNAFFAPEVARAIRAEHGPAHVVVANNVLAHVDDVHALMRGLDALLDDDGVFVAEVPYVVDLIRNVEYDTIYHEHLSYFTARSLQALLASEGFALVDVEHIETHGGSIRVYAARRGRSPETRAVRAHLDEEAMTGIDRPDTYIRLADAVRRSRDALRSMIGRLTYSGERVVGLGATAKSTTLLNFCALGPADIAFIADSTPLKQGKLTPGTRIPIVPESALLADPAARYILLLAWNYADSILARSAALVERGSRFIHPIPMARLIP